MQNDDIFIINSFHSIKLCTVVADILKLCASLFKKVKIIFTKTFQAMANTGFLEDWAIGMVRGE